MIMDTAELSMPIIGLQCTLLAIFFVMVFPFYVGVVRRSPGLLSARCSR